MFDEIPKPDMQRTKRKQAWFQIGPSVLWLGIGSRSIARHSVFGWPIVVLWAFSLLIWSRRLVSYYRGDAGKEAD